MKGFNKVFARGLLVGTDMPRITGKMIGTIQCKVVLSNVLLKDLFRHNSTGMAVIS